MNTSSTPADPRHQPIEHRISVKRAYEPAEAADGCRILVDRMWPRGVRKSDVRLTAWLRDVAPSSELRRWFGHDPEKWDAFQARYARELDRSPEAIASLREALESGPVTLVYGARDDAHNNAVALKRYLEGTYENGAGDHDDA